MVKEQPAYRHRPPAPAPTAVAGGFQCGRVVHRLTASEQAAFKAALLKLRTEAA